MKYRKLGNTGFDVSCIGFGTWQIGGMRWAKQPEKTNLNLLASALEHGVNIYDVAVVYGQYKDEQGILQSRSQELLGKAFANKRDKVFFCVKLGQIDEYAHKHDYNPKFVIQQFQQSLRRLKTDYVDICLIHAPCIAKIQDGRAITILQTLQSLGLVKSIGYSFEAEPDHVYSAINQDIDALMLQYNLLDTACSDAIDAAEKKGIGILVGGPYKRGYLTGKYSTIEDLPLTDDYWQWNVSRNKDKVADTLTKIRNLLTEYQSPINLRKASLNTILDKSNVASCVVGHRAVNEVLENIQLIS